MSNLGKILIVVLLIAIIITIKIKQNDKTVTPSPPIRSQPIPVTLTNKKAVVDKSLTVKKTTDQPADNQAETPQKPKKSITVIPVPKPAVVQTKSAALPRLLELGSDSCQPCRMMQPILAELRSEYAGKLQVDFIDIYQDKTASEKYNIQFIPVQLFYDANGKEIFRHTGFFPKSKIIDKFNELNVKL